MIYYLKKFWKRNLTVIVIQLVTYALISLQSLIQMQTFQSLIELDFRRMLIFTGISLTGWGVICLMQVFGGISVSKAIWAMNGQIRRDISATLLSKGRQDYHAQDTGEYLSWLTSGVERIENSAWDSFFGLTAYICMALTAMVTLFSVHWSLLPMSLVNALVLLLLPRLFTKKMQHLGDVCAREQAAATGKLKELLGGFDVKSAQQFFQLSRGCGLFPGTDIPQMLHLFREQPGQQQENEGIYQRHRQKRPVHGKQGYHGGERHTDIGGEAKKGVPRGVFNALDAARQPG